MLNRLQSREETFFKEGGVDVPENEEREQLLEVVSIPLICHGSHGYIRENFFGRCKFLQI